MGNHDSTISNRYRMQEPQEGNVTVSVLISWEEDNHFNGAGSPVEQQDVHERGKSYFCSSEASIHSISRCICAWELWRGS